MFGLTVDDFQIVGNSTVRNHGDKIFIWDFDLKCQYISNVVDIFTW